MDDFWPAYEIRSPEPFILKAPTLRRGWLINLFEKHYVWRLHRLPRLIKLFIDFVTKACIPPFMRATLKDRQQR